MGLRYILSIKCTFMIKEYLNIRSSPEICDLQRFFLSEIAIPQQRVTPVNLPFYNFVCYAADMFNNFLKCSLDITLNVFLVDEHIRRYSNSIEIYRRFMGFIGSWKKYGDTDEGRLLTTFLQEGRNQRKNIRKVLLKNINQKILEEIKLNHQDAVTIIHTLDLLSSEQRRVLTKKINDHFISKNVKHPSSTILNAAVLCQYLMVQVNDKKNENERFNSNLSTKLTKILKNRLDYIEEFSQQTIPRKDVSFSKDELNNQFLTNKQQAQVAVEKQNHEVEAEEGHETKKSLVNLQRCMKELYILKEKDLQIDNRFKKFKNI